MTEINRDEMLTLPANQLVEPFTKLNYWDKPDGSGRMVQAFIPFEKPIEGAKMGLAIDGSGSMRDLFGRPARGIIPGTENHVRPVARLMSSYLAKRAADGKVAVIYWATGPAGQEIQVIGDLAVDQAEKHNFDAPVNYGTGTRLVPALKYFTDGTQRKDLHDSPWAMFVFITDGKFEDLEEVKQYATQMARDIDAGRRFDLKLVIIGLGAEVDESQMEELDDLETGTSVDLFDHKLAEQMKDLSELFTEVVDETTIVYEGGGIIKDPSGSVVVDYSDTGLPALLRFTLPAKAKSFTLEFAGNVITQPLP